MYRLGAQPIAMVVRGDVRENPAMSPGPGCFHQYCYGFAHVVCDADGRIIASSVVADNHDEAPFSCFAGSSTGAPEAHPTFERQHLAHVEASSRRTKGGTTSGRS